MRTYSIQSATKWLPTGTWFKPYSHYVTANSRGETAPRWHMLAGHGYRQDGSYDHKFVAACGYVKVVDMFGYGPYYQDTPPKAKRLVCQKCQVIREKEISQ